MAKLTGKIVLDLSVTITVSESELRALKVFTQYGADNFLKVFYERLGKSDLEPHEKSVRALFDKINEVTPNLSAMDEVRKSVLETAKKFTA